MLCKKRQLTLSYDRRHFTQDGIEHVDLYFDDGTNPTDEIVRDFIRLADKTFAKGKKVAVHCKAGLGRTGVLIGAYLIYKHQFTASEVIGYMRVVRPGMVVGPQQRYMQLNQMKWAGWVSGVHSVCADWQAAADALREPSTAVESLPSPPLESNEELADVGQEDAIMPEEDAIMAHLLTPTHSVPPSPKSGDAVGQPRKGLNPVDVPEDAVDDEENDDYLVSALRDVKSDAPSPPPRPSEGSLRGIKRGSGRAPLPQALRGDEPASPPRTSESTPRLMRSSSNASCSSSVSELDQRATKRRPGDSPLPKSGLSSPPPSRDTTPAADDFTSSGFPFPIEESEETPNTPPRSTVALASGQAPPTPSATAQRPTSLIPRLVSTQNKDLPSRSQTSSSTSSADDASEILTPTPSASPRSKLPSRRLLAAPRIWNPLARVTPAQE